MTKVVPFERDSDYLAERAQVNLRAGRMMDALALQRQAVRRSQDAAHSIKLAQVLCQMGCHEQSNRVLARMLCGPDSAGMCYLGMCYNYLGMDQPEAAYRALVQYIAACSKSLVQDDVDALLHFLTQQRTRALDMQTNRRGRQAVRLAQAARQRSEKGEWALAKWMLQRAIDLRQHDPDDEIMLALAAAMAHLGDLQGAVKWAKRALRSLVQPKLLCQAAEILEMAGQHKLACLSVERLQQIGEEPDDLPLRFAACCAIKDDLTLKQMIGRMLACAPYDRVALHRCAVNCVRTGDQRRAIAFWERAVRIDPDDMIAQWYLKRAAEGALDASMPYTYALPPEEEARMRRELAQASLLQGDVLEAHFEEENLQQACRWALYCADHQALLMARNLLRGLDNPVAQALLHGSYAISSGLDDGHQLAMEVGAGHVHMPPWLRRAMKKSIDLIRREGLPFAKSILALLPRLVGRDKRLVWDVPSLTAAMHALALESCSAPCDLAKICAIYGIPLRRLRRTMNRLKDKGELVSHEAD